MGSPRFFLTTIIGSTLVAGCGLFFGDALDVSVAPGQDASTPAPEERSDAGEDPNEPVVPDPVVPEPDGSCAADRKKCDELCVSLIDPAHGCAGTSCTACTAPTNGIPICAGKACDFTCKTGFERTGSACTPTKPPNTWEAVASLPSPQGALAAAAGADGRIYAMGGSPTAAAKEVVAYTPGANAWTKLASLPSGRPGLAAAASQDGRIFAIGGEVSGGVLDRVDAYSPGTDTWAAATKMPTARAFLAVVTGLDGRIYAIGGTTGVNTPVGTVEIYTPSTNSWTTGAAMPTPRFSLGAALGADGRIYAIGGNTSTEPQGATSTTKVEVYTPGTNTWATVKSLPTGRRALSAATGTDGRIFAIGGTDDAELKKVEAYTPGTNTWTSVADMPTARFRLAAVRAGSRIFAVGGIVGFNTAVSTVEAYTP